MAVYVPLCNGYIIDNPNIDFKRCDGQVFSYDEVNTASVTNTSESQTITGGWGRSPLAYFDTNLTSEITFASSKFDLEMFSMALAENISEGDFSTLESGLYEVQTGLVVNLPFECKAGSVQIVSKRGFVEDTTAATGKFAVAITASAAATAGATVITFASGDVAIGDTLRVAYQRRVVNGERLSVTTEATTARGTLYAHFPVYTSGEDCTESAIKGYLHLCMKRCRATALPGFDASYKGAQTFSVTFAAMDAKRADKRFWDYTYEPLVGGEIVNKSGETVDWT